MSEGGTGWGASPPLGTASPSVGPSGGGSPRLLLRRLSEALSAPGDGQQRLNQIVRLIATNMVAEVCSVYLKRGADILELFATEGLNPEAVHTARLRIGEGLVGVIARDATPVNTAEAHAHPEFRYLPETGEEVYSSFLGVPIQRLGKVLGVLVVQNERPIHYSEEDAEALALVATVIGEMAEAGTLAGPVSTSETEERTPFHVAAQGAADGVAIGPVHLREPKLLLPNPIADDLPTERERLRAAISDMRGDIDTMLESSAVPAAGEHREVLETYRMFAHDRSWVKRLEEGVASGLKAEAAVDKVRTEVRARLDNASDPYLRERLHDMDDLGQRLLRTLMGPGQASPSAPKGAILVARSVGPADLMEYAPGHLSGVVLEGGSIGSHAAIVARALSIPLVTQAARVTREAEEGDTAIVNGDQGHVHIRPRADVVSAYREKLALRDQERAAFGAIRDLPAETTDGVRITLYTNAGLAADMPSLDESGAEGVGLLRTELHFMLSTQMPTRDEQTRFYAHVLDRANGKRVMFRTLDVGSDKVLPFLKMPKEDNPALGWRAIRLGLDRPVVLKMQAQALLRAARGRPLSLMFPMVADAREFDRARSIVLDERDRMAVLGHAVPEQLQIGAMLETPSLAFAEDRLYETADFISIGGNDLLQFFFAADRMNQRTAGRYDITHPAFLSLLRLIVDRCEKGKAALSFCGEAAGRPVDALVLAALGVRTLSMRPAAIGPVKRSMRTADLSEVKATIERAERSSTPVRQALVEYARIAGVPL